VRRSALPLRSGQVRPHIGHQRDSHVASQLQDENCPLSRRVTSCCRHHILAANITSNLGRARVCAATVLHSILRRRCCTAWHSHHSPPSICHHPNAQFAWQSNASSDLTHAHPPPVSNCQQAAHLSAFGIPANTFLGLFALAVLLDGAWTRKKVAKSSSETFYVDFCARPVPRHSQGIAKAQPRQFFLPTLSLGTTAQTKTNTSLRPLPPLFVPF